MNQATTATALMISALLISACAGQPRVPDRSSAQVERVELKPRPAPVEEATTVPLAMPQINQPQELQRKRPQGAEYPGSAQAGGYDEWPQPRMETIPTEQQPPAQPGNPVLVGLLAQADQNMFDGRHDQAAAAIERALRIEPKDAQLWKRLASIRLEQKRPHQAESTAKKSIRLAQGDWGLLADNWLIIAEARDLRGDAEGADRAKTKAARYQ